jgi:hypothetical protein
MSVEEQLAEIRARRAALAAEREELLAGSPDEQLTKEQRALAAEEALTAAQRQHGAKRVAMVVTDEGPVVLRCPHVAAYRKFQDAEGVDSAQTIELVKKCLLYPSAAELTRMLEAQPGALVELANTVVELAGHRKKALQAK